MGRVNNSGDPIYIAPEVLSFDRSLAKGIEVRTDVFSLGIILLEILCDITAPSQGKIFQDLRNDKINFNDLEPSPLHGKKGFGIQKKKKDSKLRPNCAQSIEQINDILNNEAYAQYFAQSD